MHGTIVDDGNCHVVIISGFSSADATRMGNLYRVHSAIVGIGVLNQVYANGMQMRTTSYHSKSYITLQHLKI